MKSQRLLPRPQRGELSDVGGVTQVDWWSMCDTVNARYDAFRIGSGYECRRCGLFRPSLGVLRQDDALYPLLTVRETLRFAAELRIRHLTRVRPRDSRALFSKQSMCLAHVPLHPPSILFPSCVTEGCHTARGKPWKGGSRIFGRETSKHAPLISHLEAFIQCCFR